MPARPRISIISPGLADANNGNWRTAARWQRILMRRHAVTIASDWPDGGSNPVPDLLIALHAHRSGEALARFKAAHPGLFPPG